MLITKNQFKDLISALRNQYDYDVKRSKMMSDLMGCDVPMSDNTHLRNVIFKLLHESFPPQESFCSIQTFCYQLDFGRTVATENDPIDELWEVLEEEANERKELIGKALSNGII